ncbi:ComEC/Rec2 family competence protein [Verrucomicrobiota bacterium]
MKDCSTKKYSGFGRRPLVGVALCYVVGTWLGLSAAVEPFVLIAACACVSVLTFWRVLRASRAIDHPATINALLLYSCVILLGAASARLADRSGPGSYRERGRLRRAVDTRCWEFRRNASDYLSAGIEEHPDAVALSRALLLGVRGEISKDAKDVFRATGTLHVFAISGLHVGMICLMIRVVLCRFRISRVHWVLFVAPLVVLYTIITGARASAVRACIMAIIYYLAPLLGRKADVASALALAGLLILLVSPAQLLDVGFVFSFVVVAGIITYYPIFERPLRRLWEVDPLRVQKEHKAISILRGCIRYVCTLTAISCSAWLASAPLTAYYFGRFAPIALVGNLVVIPLVFLIVLAGCLSLLLGSCVWVLAEIFNNANLALIWVLSYTMKAVRGIPFGSMDVAQPPIWLVLGWYVFFGSLALWLRGSRPCATVAQASSLCGPGRVVDRND